MTARGRSLALQSDVLVVAHEKQLHLRRGDGLITLVDSDLTSLIPALTLHDLAVLDHLRLQPEDRDRLLVELEALDWLRQGPEPDRAVHNDGLAAVMRKAPEENLRRLAQEGLTATTSEEALFIPTSCDPQRALRALRLFVARLDWFRLQAYAALHHLSSENIALAGDRPRVPFQPSATDSPVSYRLTDGKWRPTSDRHWEEPPPTTAGSVEGRRLSAVTVPRSATRPILKVGNRVLWLATGEHALPNLRFAGTPSAVPRVPRWCIGVDWDRRRAETKAIGEGVERFNLGDVSSKEVILRPAQELENYLDPRRIVAYGPHQHVRLGIKPFDPSHPEWWVRGERHGSSVWLPAALVFCPFDTGEAWLAPGYSSSNGGAAHTSPHAARLHAWLELVERDAFMRTYLSAIPPPRLAISMLPPSVQELHNHVQAIADEAALLLLESSVEVRAVLACAWRNGRLCLGASAHPDLSAAAEKALTEVVVQVTTPLDLRSMVASDVRTPEDHGRLYADPKMSRRMLWLLDGDELDRHHLAAEVPITESSLEAFSYVRRVGNWFVARALDPRLLVLTFGWDNELLGHPAARAMLQSDAGDRSPLIPHPFP